MGAFLGVLAVAALASVASAHTALTASTPAEGQTLTELERVSLEFSGNLLDIGATLTVVSGNSERFELDVEFPTSTVVEAAVPTLVTDDYVLEWRVVAEDGHPIEGVIAFRIEAPAPASPSPAPAPDPTVTTPSPSPAAATPDATQLGGDFGEKVSQNLSPLDALLIALVGAVMIAIAWLIARRVGAREQQPR